MYPSKFETGFGELKRRGVQVLFRGRGEVRLVMGVSLASALSAVAEKICWVHSIRNRQNFFSAVLPKIIETVRRPTSLTKARAHSLSSYFSIGVFNRGFTLIMSAPTPAGSCKTVLAGGIAKKLLSEVSSGLKTLGRRPRLYGFLANQDPAARMYADWTARTCTEK